MKYPLQIWFSTVLLSVTLVLSGCFAPDQPTEAQIQTQSTAYFDRENPSLFEAISIQKTNGYKQNDTYYVAELTITARAKQGLEEYIRSITKDPSLSAFEKMTTTMQAGLMKMTMESFETDDKFEYNKQYLFIKTDNGWLLKKDLTAELNP